MHVPTLTSVTVAEMVEPCPTIRPGRASETFKVTVQTPVVSDENAGSKPELVEADTLNAASPYILSASVPNVIVWLAWATVKLCVTCVAAL